MSSDQGPRGVVRAGSVLPTSGTTKKQQKAHIAMWDNRAGPCMYIPRGMMYCRHRYLSIDPAVTGSPNYKLAQVSLLICPVTKPQPITMSRHLLQVHIYTCTHRYTPCVWAYAYLPALMHVCTTVQVWVFHRATSYPLRSEPVSEQRQFLQKHRGRRVTAHACGSARLVRMFGISQTDQAVHKALNICTDMQSDMSD